ncbi:MAG: hypothetical protein H0W44_02685 [Gammaproteobacteria bacterium]|nr:hypothetical protein [Gammaproteobacteria bacterium]
MLKKGLFTTALLLCSLPVLAGELIIGAKVGVIDYNFDNALVTTTGPALKNAEADNATNMSVQGSYEFLNLAVADLAFEAEYSRSLSDATIEPVVGPKVEAGFQSTAVYISARSAGPVYVIARLGAAQAEIGDLAEDTGTAFGVGAGFSLGIRWELEYTQYDIDEIEVKYLSLGLAF